MDATYRSDVRAIADAQSARIDTQMGQLRAELRQEIGGLESGLRQEIGELRAELRVGFTAVNDRFLALETRRDAKLEALKSELLRRMFYFWVGSIGSVLLLLKA